MTHKIVPCKSIRIENVAWPDVERALSQGAAAILPVGAACKQHGKHLPMNTDFIQAEYLATQIMQDAFVAVWPTVSYGYYPAFINYPGSISLSEQTFTNLVSDIGNSIISAGPTRLLIINTGISTIRPLQAAISGMGNPGIVELINVYSGAECKRVSEDMEQQVHGSHADELETSIMLAIAPELVDTQKASDTTFEMRKGPLNREHPDQPNYSPSGVYGDATLATREKGEALISAMLKDIHEYINTSAQK